MLDANIVNTWQRIASSNTQKISTEVIATIPKLSESFKSVENIVSDLSVIICPFNDELVNSLEAALQNAADATDLVKKMRKLIDGVNKFKIPPKRFFMRIETFHIDDKLNKNIENFRKMTKTSREQLLKDVETIKENTETLKKKLSTAIESFRTEINKITFTKVQTEANGVIQKMNSKQSSSSDSIRRLNSELDKSDLVEFLNENSERSKKLRGYKRTIIMCLSELHELWEYLPEQFEEYATEHPRIMWSNPLRIIDGASIESVNKQITYAISAINLFMGGIEGENFKRKWIGDIGGFYGAIYSTLGKVNLEIGSLNLVSIEHICSVIYSNEIIKLMPCIPDLKQVLTTFIRKCSSYVTSLSPQMIHKFAEELLTPRGNYINNLNNKETPVLEGIISTAIEAIGTNREAFEQEVGKLSKTIGDFVKETDDIRLLLCKLKYTIQNKDTDIEFKKQMVTGLVEEIRTEVLHANETVDRIELKPLQAELRKLIDALNGSQDDLKVILNRNIPVKRTRSKSECVTC